MDIWLNRLGSGAKIEIILKSEDAISLDKLTFSAVSDQSSSLSIEKQTLADQIKSIEGYTTDVLDGARGIIENAESVQKTIVNVQASSTLSQVWHTTTSKDFWIITASIGLLVITVGILIPSRRIFLSALVVGMGFILFVFFDGDFPLSLYLDLLALLGMIYLLRQYSTPNYLLNLPDSRKYLIIVLILSILGYLNWYFWNSTITYGAIIFTIVILLLLRIYLPEYEPSSTNQNYEDEI